MPSDVTKDRTLSFCFVIFSVDVLASCLSPQGHKVTATELTSLKSPAFAGEFFTTSTAWKAHTAGYVVLNKREK